MSKQEVRLFHMSDSSFISFSLVYHGNYIKYRERFTSVDRNLNQDYGDDLLALIQTASNIEPDEVIVDRQSQLTNSVKEKLKECREHINLMFYFAGQAFPDDELILDEFGKDNYGEVKNSYDKMKSFMKVLHGVSQKYTTQLIDTGASQEQIDKIETLYNELTHINFEQSMFIGDRPNITKQRIMALNAVFKKMLRINELAKIIFADDYPVYKLFLLPKRSTPKKDSSIEIQPGEKITVADEGIEQGLFIKVENTGKTDLTFCVSETDIESPHANAAVINAGKEETVKADEISNDTFGKLFAFNNTAEKGTFKIVLLE